MTLREVAVSGARRKRTRTPERSFFVDEAGDPVGVAAQLEELRLRLLADPYFRGVPSMAPSGSKTAIAFHAKDDLPEVRREVFSLLRAVDVRMIVLVRRKLVIAQVWKERFERTGARLNPDHLYDDLVARGFFNLLHRADVNRVTFARRGKADRNRALRAALEQARSSFNAKWGTSHHTEVVVRQSTPSESPGIQVADYLLWAVQRLYERGEDRYFELMRDHFSLIVDVDDTRHSGYGTYFDRRRLLSVDAMKPVSPG